MNIDQLEIKMDEIVQWMIEEGFDKDEIGETLREQTFRLDEEIESGEFDLPNVNDEPPL